jgi:cephalosporin hydroxylase
MAEQADDLQRELREISRQWMSVATRTKYAYNFTWLGRPIFQLGPDLVAMQEIVWRVRPEVIVETGIARGGSLVFYASLLELVGGPGEVIGIDIDIRAHNRVEIEAHPLARRITLVEGSSVDPLVAESVKARVGRRSPVLVVLDSNHTHDHVLSELSLYSPLVTRDSYLVVFDTAIEDLPDELFADRPWGRGNNPKTAVWEFLKTNERFRIDHEVESRLAITVAPDGYLRCVQD